MGRETLYLNVDLYDLLSQLPKRLKWYRKLLPDERRIVVLIGGDYKLKEGAK